MLFSQTTDSGSNGSLRHQSDDIINWDTLRLNTPKVLVGSESRMERTRGPVIMHMGGSTYSLSEREGNRDLYRSGKVVDKSIRHFLKAVYRNVKVTDSPSDKCAESITNSFVHPFLCRRLAGGQLTVVQWADWVRSFKQMFDELRTRVGDDQIAWGKYHCDLAMWKAVGDANDPPQSPDGPKVKLFHGAVWTELKRRIVKRDLCFIYSIQKGSKSSWPPVSDNKVASSLYSHYSVLTTRSPDVDESKIRDIFNDFHVRRFFNEIFPRKVFYGAELLIPSISACAEESRQKGGALQYYEELLPKPSKTIRGAEENIEEVQEKLYQRCRTLQSSSIRSDDEVAPGSSGRPRPEILSDLGLIPGTLKRVRGFSDIAKYAPPVKVENDSSHRLRDPSRGIEVLRVNRVQHITEPGKVRTVTVGSADRALALGPLQARLLEAWKACRFSTMKDEDLTTRASLMAEVTPSEWEFYSVDYKSATDLLHSETSIECLRAIGRAAVSDGIPIHSENYDVGLLDLKLGDLMVYSKEAMQPRLSELPEKEAKRIYLESETVISQFLLKTGYSPDALDQFRLPPISQGLGSVKRQKNRILKHLNKHFIFGVRRRGQLMGHWLSFPLLCATNLAGIVCAGTRYCASIRDFSLIKTFSRGNLLINGDDVMFRAPRGFFPFLKDVTSTLGFQFSVGKNYISKFFCQMNSQVFTAVEEPYVENPSKRNYFEKAGTKNLLVRRVGYMSMKLLTGVSPKTGQSMADPVAIAKDVSKMLDFVPWAGAVAYKTLMDRCASKISGKTGFGDFTPNWFLPVHLGGLGVDRVHAPIIGSHERFSLPQRKVAAYFHSHQDLPRLLEAVVDGGNLRDQTMRLTTLVRSLLKDNSAPTIQKVILENHPRIKSSEFLHRDIIQAIQESGMFSLRNSPALNAVSKSLSTISMKMVGEGPLPEGFEWGDRGNRKGIPTSVGIRASLGYYFSTGMTQYIRDVGVMSALIPSPDRAGEVVFRFAFLGSGNVRPLKDFQLRVLEQQVLLEPVGPEPGRLSDVLRGVSSGRSSLWE